MKVLILANNDLGLYKFRREVIEALLKENEVFICLPNGEYVEKLVDIGCKYLECDINRHGMNPLQDLKLIRRYSGVIKRCKPDIVFTYTIKPNVYGGMVCASKRIPYVANITGLGTAVENPGVLQKLTLTLYRFGLRKAQKVFFQNSENQEFMLKNRVVRGEYDLLPGSGVNLERYPLREYPIDDVIKFAFISRIMKEKGIDQYLEAAEAIKNKYENVEFHVCGFCEPEYDGKLQEMNAKGIVIYHGMIRDVAVFMGEMHCIVHPTYYPEGISNVLLEACATGRPIITTNRSGCREVVDDGVNGYMIQQKDSQALTCAVEKFLGLSLKEKKQKGINARGKVEKEFNRKIVVQKYVDEVEKV